MRHTADGRGDAQPAAARPGRPLAPAAERRLVSVLFADLVGFTAASESRDAEETRELLTQYFDAARTTIERYGGTVEKFIGDAVMAVWGAPVAQEDDAERAVRAALGLVDAVVALGVEAGAPELRVRAGVLTGEAAVTIGAEGQGMVAGDLVNTASRIQSAAEPGTVLVGAATRRASQAAIAYEDAGSHEMKGKTEPMQLWRARQVTAGRGGALKSVGLEAPFVGRDGEFRLIRDLFHATADERRARLVSVTGVAGIGKSRLLWELFKYVDGLVEQIWWHRGRCLAYGEGVAYWALAEMVRGRAGIVEEEDVESAATKLRATLEENVSDPDERAWMEPRLAHLLALEEHAAWERDDLFSAWRVFFERLADQNPCVLVFEDLHWGDSGLLDFVEHVLEWSRSQPLFILTLARPELADRRPDWGAGKRNFTSLFLEPLAVEEMDELVGGLAAGLPERLSTQIHERADGIPLYAVETVRMLLDRNLLERDGDEYRVAGPVEQLEVPETLHALIAARLDALPAAERRLLEDASVLGKTFTKHAVAEVSGQPEDEVEPLLASLVRKEVLGVQADPRSPERGQYGFLQALIQRVTYETLSRVERKARHLAVAAYLEGAWRDEEELVEVLAAHYLDAYRAQPEAADAPALKERARDRLREAGERAASLGANREAERYFEQAVELAESEAGRASLHERVGDVAAAAGRTEQAFRHYEQAVGLFSGEGEERSAALVSARIAEVLWLSGRLAEALERTERAYETLRGQSDEAVAAVAAELGRLRLFSGNLEGAAETLDVALAIGQRDRLHHTVAQALITRSLVYEAVGRPEESIALLERALALALALDAPALALRAYHNRAFLALEQGDEAAAIRHAEAGVAFARQRGDRRWEDLILSQLSEPLFLVGRWDDALRRIDEITTRSYHTFTPTLTRLHLHRGELEEAQRLVDSLPSDKATDPQEQSVRSLARAALLRALGRNAEALVEADAAAASADAGGPAAYANDGAVEAIEIALELGDTAGAGERLARLDAMPPVKLVPLLDAQRKRLYARLAAQSGDAAQAEAGFKAAAAHLRELELPFHLAVTLLEQAEWLAAEGREDEASAPVAEARETFERLGATPWLERAGRVGAVAVSA